MTISNKAISNKTLVFVMFLLYCFCIKLNDNFPAFIKHSQISRKMQSLYTKHKVSYTGFINISKMEGICVGGGLKMVKHQACTTIIVAPKLANLMTGKGQISHFSG